MDQATLSGTSVPLPPLPDGWHLVTAAVLADGTLGMLTADADLAAEWNFGDDGQLLGDPFRVANHARARLWIFDGNEPTQGPTFPLETAWPSLDRFRDGRWLIVSMRTNGPANARLLNPDGQLLSRFMLGDGIQNFGVDRRDNIWVGWFDEGINGNTGWSMAGEEWPPSSKGIGLFGDDGRYIPLPEIPAEAGPIDDCCALNIAGERAWTCHFMNFPLIELRPDNPARWWSIDFAGPTALAVTDNHVLFAGGYGADADRLILVALGDMGQGEAAATLGKWRLPLAPRVPLDGATPSAASDFPWEYPTLLTGRNDAIHMLQNGHWHRWWMSDALRAADALS